MNGGGPVKISALRARVDDEELRIRGILDEPWKPTDFRGHPHPGQKYKHGWIPIGGSAGDMRQALSDAKDIDELNAALAGEAKRITGRDIHADLSGLDVDVAREYGEGIARGLERFPDATLTGVYTYGPGSRQSKAGSEMQRLHPDASAVTQAYGVMEGGRFIVSSNIYFNAGPAADSAAFRAGREQAHADGFLVTGTPMGTALHEFGHVVTNQTGSKRTVYDSAVTDAEHAGIAPSAYISRHVSKYASSDMGEFAAEAFTDVMSNGSAASATSESAFQILEAAYKAGKRA